MWNALSSVLGSPPAVSAPEVSNNDPNHSSQENSVASDEAIPSDFHAVCSLSDLPIKDRKCIVVEKRSIVLYRRKANKSQSDRHNNQAADGSEVYALDSICYHMGGPLVEGDIEEIAGHTTIVCPWHKYHISVETGEGFYMALDRQWKSKGVKQRTHQCIVRDDQIFVRISTAARDGGGKIDSDTYCDKAAGASEVAAKEATRRAKGPQQMLKSSGHIFNSKVTS